MVCLPVGGVEISPRAVGETVDNNSGICDDQGHFEVRAKLRTFFWSLFEGRHKGFVMKRGVVSHHCTIRRSAQSALFTTSIFSNCHRNGVCRYLKGIDSVRQAS